MCAARLPRAVRVQPRASARPARPPRAEFDLVHDNQCLGTGLLGMMRRRLAVRAHAAPPDHRRPRPRPRARHDAPCAALHAAALVRVPRHADAGGARSSRASSRCRRTRSKDIVAADGRATPTRCTSCRSASTRSSSARCPHVARVPGRLMTTASADVPLKGLRTAARGAGQGAHRARRRAPRGHRPAAGTSSRSPRRSSGSACSGAVEFVTGVTDERIVELYAEAEVAVVPSLYEGFSLPAIEAMACGVPLVTTTGGALPEVVGTDGETGAARCRPATPARSRSSSSTVARRRRAAGPARRARAARRVLDRFTWRKTAEGTVEQYYRELEAHAAAAPRRRDAAPDADRRLRPARPARRATACSTSAAAAAATRSRRCGAARRVVALDYAAAELKDVARRRRARCSRRARSRTTQSGGVVNGDALRLPFPDGTFDRVIASEVLEHIWDDDARDRRARPRAAARRPHRGHRPDRAGPSASAGRSTTSTTTRPAATSASTASTSSSGSSSAPASGCAARTTRTRCTRRTGG